MAEPGILFAAGGTGGHLYPAVAVVEELRRMVPHCRVMLAGTGRPFESALCADAGLDYASLPTLPPSVAFRSPLRFLRENWRAVRGAKRCLKEFAPSVVVGCGGYASAPIVWAASRLGIPIVLLEQNVLPGRATRSLSRLANLVCLPCLESGGWLRASVPRLVTGNPVRREIAELTRWVHFSDSTSSRPETCQQGDPAQSQTSIPPQQQNRSHVDDSPTDDSPKNSLTTSHPSPYHSTPSDSTQHETVRFESTRRTLLVLGGSLGSTTINDAILSMISEHPEALAGCRVIHQTGSRDLDRIQERYAALDSIGKLQGVGELVVRPYLNNMPQQFEEASVVISRAGATTLAELACAGRASILIPYRAAKDDHQTFNARWLSDRGAAMLVPEGDQLADRLLAAISPLISADVACRQELERKILAVAVPDAARNVCEALLPFLG